jgi:hypothetical protein
MTSIELLRLYRAAARNARKANRTLQTRSEKLETFLDRQVLRKARPDKEAVHLAGDYYTAINDATKSLEKALTDLALSTGIY